MKNFLVIGNPIEHSLSPELHNYWIKENNIDAIYNKRQLNENDIRGVINEVQNGKIEGINVTIPFKKLVIEFLKELTPIAKEAQSVNTIYKKNNKVVGDNTDVGGFKCALKHINYNVKGKKVFILGAGGVAPSIILALKELEASEIILSNRTMEKAEELKKIYSYLKIIEWGKMVDFDMIINATSLGLKNEDKIGLDLNKVGSNKLFYDLIYNPSKTNFLLEGERLRAQIENGKMMFIYQAQLAFKIWHNTLPKVHNKLLEK